MNKVVLACIGTAVVASSAGAVAGYFYAKEKLELEYNIRFNEEMSRELEEYDRLNKTGQYRSLEDVAEKRLPKRTPQKPVGVDDSVYPPADITEEDLAKTLEHLRYMPSGDTPEEWENKVVTTPSEKVEDEDTTTDRNDPYIISVEVWMAKEKDYHTPQLFFYSGNNVLTDSDGDVIEASVIGGVEVLEQFGLMSNDVNLLYVRNDEKCCDFEILRFEESYED